MAVCFEVFRPTAFECLRSFGPHLGNSDQTFWTLRFVDETVSTTTFINSRAELQQQREALLAALDAVNSALDAAAPAAEAAAGEAA